MCTENHVCFGRIHGSQLREGANAGQHTPTLSLPPSHHCLDGEVYRGNRHYNVCEHVHVYHGTMVQAHMLARIVVEVRAADVAVELEPQHGARILVVVVVVVVGGLGVNGSVLLFRACSVVFWPAHNSHRH